MVWNVTVKSASKRASEIAIWNVSEGAANRSAVNLMKDAAARFIAQLQVAQAGVSRIVKTKCLSAPNITLPSLKRQLGLVSGQMSLLLF